MHETNGVLIERKIHRVRKMFFFHMIFSFCSVYLFAIAFFNRV